jgi:hypothetical protein
MSRIDYVDSKVGSTHFPDLLGDETSVLIIGGGPTTLEIDRFKDIKADCKVSTSTCYLNNSLHKIGLTHHIVSVQTDFASNEFRTFHHENPLMKFIVEPNHLWKAPTGYKDVLRPGNYSTITIQKEFRVGIVSRAILAYIISGFRYIYFVGFDGYSKDGKAQHAFLKNKTELDPSATVNTYEKIYKNFEEFFEFVEDLRTDYEFNLVNLGAGHPSNVPTTLGYR